MEDLKNLIVKDKNYESLEKKLEPFFDKFTLLGQGPIRVYESLVGKSDLSIAITPFDKKGTIYNILYNGKDLGEENNYLVDITPYYSEFQIDVDSQEGENNRKISYLVYYRKN